jgi:hypothetical protein
MRVPANLFVVVALAGSLLFASPALAQDDEEEEYPIDPTLTGVYLGASMGVAWDDFREAGEFSPSQLSSLIVGYRGSEYISLESEFEWLAGFQRKDEEIDGWMTSLGFRVHFPRWRVGVPVDGQILDLRGGDVHLSDQRGPALRSRIAPLRAALQALRGVLAGRISRSGSRHRP